MAMFLGLFGCGGAPVASDPASARSVLETVLESWKRGDSPQALRDGTPPLNVADYRWEGKYKLNAYTIAESSAAAGFDQRFSVDLRLTTPKGKASREKAVYHVATSPAIAVVRDPES
jgi:hypothetical protein